MNFRSLCTALAALTLPFCAIHSAARERKPLYKNPKATVEERVEDLLSRMTLDEKVCQLQNCFVETDSKLVQPLKAFALILWMPSGNSNTFRLEQPQKACESIQP